jgi:hypothetical protein
MIFFHSKKLRTPLLILGSAVALAGQAYSKDTSGEQPIPHRFEIINDSLVMDTTTNLMWQRCALGQTWDGNTCAGIAESYRWKEAMSAAEQNGKGGYHDWYLPAKEELESLIDPELTQPTIDQKAFPNTPNDMFWSSSANVANAEYLKTAVNYRYKYIRSAGSLSVSSYARVRLVRQADTKE